MTSINDSLLNTSKKNQFLCEIQQQLSKFEVLHISYIQDLNQQYVELCQRELYFQDIIDSLYMHVFMLHPDPISEDMHLFHLLCNEILYP